MKLTKKIAWPSIFVIKKYYWLINLFGMLGYGIGMYIIGCNHTAIGAIIASFSGTIYALTLKTI